MRWSRNPIPRFTPRHRPAGAIRIAVLAALSTFGCQGPPEEASAVAASTALLADGAACTANDQCSSGVCSGGVCVASPDLVATAITGAPAQVSAQQLVAASWTVANRGAALARGSTVPCCSLTDHGSSQYNNRWFDRFFLSTDMALSTDDVFVGEYIRPDNFTLAAGASYTASASIHIPTVAAGSYYLILVTDAYGNRVLESDETNNTFAIPVTVGQADLVATSLTGVPAQGSAQQLLPVSWTVKNQATTGAATGSLVPCCTQTDHGSYQYNNLWFDRFFLSTDPALSTDDVFIAEYARPDNFTLAAGASYTASASIHVPSVAPGSYYLILTADAYGDRVPESDGTNNAIAVPITVGQADLVTTSLTGVPAQGSAQQLLPVSWTVKNQATTGAATGSLVPCCTQTDHGSYQYNNLWFDRFFLSTDPALSTDDVFIAEYARPDNFTLAAGASYTASASIHVPSVAPGSYYLILTADAYGDRVPESDGTNNAIAVPITVGQADLAVSSLTGVPEQAAAQQLLPVSWTVTNQSATGAASGSLVPCCARTDHGSYQYNNLWFDRFFLSTDAALSTDDVFIAEYARPDNFTLAAGASYTASASIQLPAVALGNYYVVLVTDAYGNRVPESDETNNTIAVPITVGQADLVVSSFTGVPAQASAQQLLPVSWTVTNQATFGAASGSLVPCCTQTDHGSYQYNHIWFDRFFLSTDATLGADDAFIGEYPRPDGFTLAAGGSYTATASIQVPTVTSGSYYVILVTDGYGNRVQESNETNNIVVVPVTVGQADLVVSTFTGVPAEASAQQLIPVSWTVINQSTTGAASGSLVPCCTQTDHGSYQYNHLWFDRFFLSTDATLGADDAFIGEYPRPDSFTLAAGASYSASASIHVPTVAAGSYYLIVITDGYGDRVPESNESNNTFSVPITVGQADLAAAAVTGMPAQASSQQLVPIAWTVTNQATTGAASGSLVPCCARTDQGSYQYNNLWFDRFFVSTDATLSADDTFLGEYGRPDGFKLAAGASYTATATLQIPDLPAGSYYLILASDAYGDRVPEGDETNNTFAVPFDALGRPDLLAVALAGAPAQASSQQPLQLTWTVKNQAAAGEASGSNVPCCARTDHGSYQYNHLWFDRLVLSTDATLSADDTFLGEYARPDGFTLAGGASYSGTATLQLPRIPAGSYYLIFTTDGYGNRVPETDEVNNTVVVPVTGVTNADLTVSNLSAPTGALGNKQSAAVSWTITNGGTGTAWHSWQDKIYISQNPVFDSTATYVDFVSHTSDLPAGASYDVTKVITLPNLTTGSYYFFVLTDASDAIAEANETNNGAVSAVPVTLQPTALVQPEVALALPTGASRTTRSPVFSPDGTRLAIADGNRADLWSLDTLASTGSFTGHTNAVASVRFSPLGDQVLTASLDGTLQTWDPVSFSPKQVLDQSNYYNPAVFSSDGTRILAGSNSNTGVAKLWDARSGAVLGSFIAGYNVTAVALSPSDSVAVTGGGGGRATLWSVATFTRIAELAGHNDAVNAVAFSPDGSEFLTASSDGSIRFWDSATGASLGTIIQGRHVVDARYSGDGQYIVSCDDYAPGHTTQNTQAYLFTRGGRLMAVFQPQGWADGVSATLGGVRPGFTGVALSPDSTTLATTYKTNSTDPVAGVFLWKTGLPAIPIVPAVPVALASSHPFTIQPGGKYLFEFTVADGQPGLVIHLAGTPHSATYPSTAGADPVAVQMYLSQSGMPSPTSYLDAADARSSALSANLLASPAVGGTYRVLVTAASLNGGTIDAEISANYSGFFLSSVEGNKVGNAGRATFRVRGIQLPTAIGLVSPSSGTLAPLAVSYRDPTRVFAMFDLTGVPVGSYDLQATSGSTTLTLAGAVTVTTGTGPALSFSLQAPPAIRRSRAYDYAVTYVNTGDSDAVAPFVSVTPAEDGALLYPDGTHRPGSGIWLAGADGWPSAVIPAGARGTIRFRASWNTTAGVTVSQLPEDATPFDWTQMLSNLPPADSPQGWTQAQAVMGSSYGQVLGQMRAIAVIGTGPVDFTQVALSSMLVSLQGNQL